MSKSPLTEIVVRVPRNRPATEKDCQAVVGIEFLEQRLFQVGWIEEAGMWLKRFKISSKAYSDHGENDIDRVPYPTYDRNIRKRLAPD